MITLWQSPDVSLSTLRFNLLRLAYAPLAFGLALMQLPSLAELGPEWEITPGVVVCMLSALCILSFVGLLKPIFMLPLLLFEVTWKAIWLSLVGIPAWAAGSLDPGMADTLFACLLVLPIVLLVPWDFVTKKIVRPSA